MTGAVAAAAGFNQNSLDAVATPAFVVGNRSGPGSIVSSSTSVSVTGGVGSKSYVWEYVSGDTLVFATSVSSPITTFTGYNETSTFSSVWRCKVIDSLGTITYTNNVTASFTRY